MPAFKLDQPDWLTGIVAYLRNMNTFDAAALMPGDAARRPNRVRGQGRRARGAIASTARGRAWLRISAISAAAAGGERARAIAPRSDIAR